MTRMSLPPLVLSILALALCSPLNSASAATNFTCGSDPAHFLCLPPKYNKDMAPRRSTRVGVSMWVTEVAVENEGGGIRIGGFLNIKWMDDRITVRRSQFGNTAVQGPSEMFESLWRPDLFIYGLKELKVAKVLDPLSKFWVDATKSYTVTQSQSVRMVIDCGLCLRNFPLDVHTCSVRFGSYSAPSPRLQFYTDTDNSGFMLMGDKASWDSSSPFTFAFEPLPEEQTFFDGGRYGNFSVAGFQISVMRNLGPYMISYYVSSAVVVILSWASFVIPNRRIPSRFTYLAVLLLALICVIGTAEVASPRANVLTSLQIWFLVCTLFLLAPALEFGVLLLRQRRRCRRRAVTVRRVKYEAAAGGSASLGQGGSLNGAGAGEDPAEDYDEEFWKYDRVYLCLFPVLFLFFNLVYWLTYAV